jgi:hypothetical protein
VKGAHHLSMKVRGLSAASLTPLLEPAFWGVAKGLEYRDREARWEESAMVQFAPSRRREGKLSLSLSLFFSLLVVLARRLRSP